jgi:monoamine oxidase
MAGGAAACSAFGRTGARARIAIVGAGAAGLSAAHRLADRADCTLYEASNRVGGRMFTRRNFTPEGQFCELGGELVDTGHEALIKLAAELGVEIQRIAPEGEQDSDLFSIGGNYYRARDMFDPATGAGAFIPIAPRLAADQAALLDDAGEWTERARALDNISLRTYLDAFRPLTAAWAIDLLDLAYLGEYGRPTSEQSALNLVDLIGADEGPFAMFGDSDEAHRIAGGSSSLIEALERVIAVRAPIKLRHSLAAVEATAEGVRLIFSTTSGEQAVVADRVILALPFTRLRAVRGVDELGLDPLQLEAIRSLGYGANAKLMVATHGKPWRDRAAPAWFDGAVYSDAGLQIAWDTSRGQAGEGGILTNFMSPPLSGSEEDEAYATLSAGLAALSPAFANTLVADNRVSFYWNRHPHSLGSYTCAAPGQYTRLLEAALEPALGGRIWFAGEHTSLDYQGFMNGAVESGERVAATIQSIL